MKIMARLASAAMALLIIPLIAMPSHARDVDPSVVLAAAPTAMPEPGLGPMDTPDSVSDPLPEGTAGAVQDSAAPAGDRPTEPSGTFRRDDLISGAEGAFGKGAKGLAKMIESILADQGEPNAYIAGREASGAIGLGLRYGSGTMNHAVEGQRPVYWTGPSIGFDLGGDAANVFVLVYNLYDGQELYRRYPQVEGRAYYVGGLSATYLRRGSVVLIPIRLGVGLRAGVNAGYLKFSEKSKWLPF